MANELLADGKEVNMCTSELTESIDASPATMYAWWSSAMFPYGELVMPRVGSEFICKDSDGGSGPEVVELTAANCPVVVSSVPELLPADCCKALR